MRVIEIRLPDVMYEELVTAANVCCVGGPVRYGPEDFATDCVASELAARRLLRADAPQTNARA